MLEYGFVRVGAIVNKLVLASPMDNAKEIVKMIKKADKEGVSIVTTAELALTGYTCSDLFLQDELLDEAEKALGIIIESTKDLDIISIIGMPIRCNNQLLNTAVVIEKGNIIGVVPKTYIPNYSEFYEKRWFTSSFDLKVSEVNLLNRLVPISTKLIFKDKKYRKVSFAIEICEDLWSVFPPSNNHALNGASIIFNLSSSNEIVGKDSYRRNLVSMQSAKTISGYVYASSGIMESTSDLVFGGASLIYENGKLLKSNKRFELESNLIYTDIDVKRLINERCRNSSFTSSVYNGDYKVTEVNVCDKIKSLDRTYKMYPFIPVNDKEKRFEEILEIQSNALTRRILHLNNTKCVIGMSGGLDSTLAFLVIVRAFRKLGRDNKDIIGVTMPGFGTTDRTYLNAINLVKEYGATLREVSIKEASILHMRDIGLDEDDRSVTYENIQARERTQILMDIANMVGGIVIGTGDLSELALGWCTYNGDHMSMYSVNSSIPKTLVRHLVEYVKENSTDKRKKILTDILDTPISPELLPPDEAGNILQKTESSIGPYVLHDFFLYHLLRYGASFKKIYLLAKITFKGSFESDEIKKWLKVFVKRFYTQQFKRNAVPDGVKVGTISLSPRGDLRMPSEASYEKILEELKIRQYNNVNCLADEAIEFYKHNGFSKGKNFAWMDMVLSENCKSQKF